MSHVKTRCHTSSVLDSTHPHDLTLCPRLRKRYCGQLRRVVESHRPPDIEATRRTTARHRFAQGRSVDEAEETHEGHRRPPPARPDVDVVLSGLHVGPVNGGGHMQRTAAGGGAPGARTGPDATQRWLKRAAHTGKFPDSAAAEREPVIWRVPGPPQPGSPLAPLRQTQAPHGSRA